jgi:uncharacterized membrane protein YhhN
MMSPRVLVTLVGVACIALVALLLADMPAPAAAAKFIASTAFVSLAIRSGALASVYGRLILTGLALSWCGDMFLIGLSKTAFLAGLFAFLMAHVAYVAAFVRHGYERRVFVWLEPYTPPDLLNPVRAYVAVISLMVIFAIGTQGHGASKLIVAGATLFFLSDLSVASLRLVQTEYPTYIIGLPLYYAGQVCLALSSSHSRSH